ncbi:MmgE/PrpD family protein [Actinomadura sp. B10D3]|uniref:MmgE/PrpD family protein n=1 Tax=Actinomadura sp. B10D3 TaxID=3153557 RepID=UPI00325E6FC0
MTDATGEIARFVAATRYRDLDAATVEHLKRLVLDGIANAVGGLRTAASRIQDGVVSGLGSERATFLHPGATAIAPSLALGEKLSAHGRDVLAAVAVGYEVPIRVAEAAFPSPERLGEVWGFAP